MKVIFHKNFRKEFKKLKQSEQKRALSRINIFQNDPFDEILNNHELKGRLSGFRSINLSGDLRAHYTLVSEDTAFFVLLGTHSDLYE